MSEPPQLTVRYFDDWKSIRLTCSVCAWQGLVDESRLNHLDSERHPVSFFPCPGCGKTLLTIEHSATLEDSLANLEKLSPEQRARVLETSVLQAEFEELRLKAPSQLPDLDLKAGSNKLQWIETRDAAGRRCSEIRHGDRVVWRQPSGDGVTEFARIAAIIRERYGDAVRDLTPTEASIMSLTGDAPWLEGHIDKARRSLGWTRLP